jgi:hypothetical protein
MNVVAKGPMVFLGTVALSWAVTAVIRRIPVAGRII